MTVHVSQTWRLGGSTGEIASAVLTWNLNIHKPRFQKRTVDHALQEESFTHRVALKKRAVFQLGDEKPPLYREALGKGWRLGLFIAKGLFVRLWALWS